MRFLWSIIEPSPVPGPFGTNRVLLKSTERNMGQDVGVTVTQTSDEQWELERAAKLKARARRQPVILITVFNLLITAVAGTAVVDLRRLKTPSGTGLRWLQAALYGDCKDYLTYSLPDPARPDRRTHDQFCQDLRTASRTAQAESVRVGMDLRVIGAEQVAVKLTRKGVTKTVVMHVVKRNGHWRVLRDELTCRSVGCA
jgi:hypothetical protein